MNPRLNKVSKTYFYLKIGYGLDLTKLKTRNLDLHPITIIFANKKPMLLHYNILSLKNMYIMQWSITSKPKCKWNGTSKRKNIIQWPCNGTLWTWYSHKIIEKHITLQKGVKHGGLMLGYFNPLRPHSISEIIRTIATHPALSSVRITTFKGIRFVLALQQKVSLYTKWFH
jgi:hypothetical protein